MRLGSEGIRHSLIINDIDLSRGMRSAQLTLAANELPTLVLDPIIFTLDAVELSDAQIIVASEAAKALVALGWTPPAGQPTPSPTNSDRHTE